MKTLIRFRLLLLAAAMVPLLLLSSSAFNANTSSSHDSPLGFGRWYMPLCTLIIYPQQHPECVVNAAVVLSDGVSMKSNGYMSMAITGNSSDGDAVAYQTLTPLAFNSQGDSPDLGHVVWSLDQTRQLTADEVTLIQANVAGQLYPATCDIYFYVQATADAYPGQVFRSATPVHMHAGDLNAFNPHINGEYASVGPIDFTDDDGNIAFTVQELTSTLN